MTTLSLGVAAYGPQDRDWWMKFALTAGTLNRYGIDLYGIHTAGSMATDHNRNAIVASFLETGSEWLLWMDTDNAMPLGGPRRLLDAAAEGNRTIVTGLYYLKAPPHTPIAYLRDINNRYTPIENWRRGEIVPVNMAGMGCVLTHRSVYEDIQKQCTVLQRYDGSIFAIHKSKIKGNVPNKFPAGGKALVKGGRFVVDICRPQFEIERFPFFAIDLLRTEDVIFYELAAQCGHTAWCDTSVEVPHTGMIDVDGGTYRKALRKKKNDVWRVRDVFSVDEIEAVL